MPDLHTTPTNPALPLSAGALPQSACAQWDAWYTRDARLNLPLTNTEIDLFHQHVDAAPGMLALDAGCGTGHWSRRLANTGLGVLAMDASPTALALARRQGSRSNLNYAQHDFDTRPIPPSLRPGTFDVIMCRNTLPYLDRHRFLVDAARWLTPTGQLHLTVPLTHPDAPPPPPWAQGLSAGQIRSLGAGWQTRADYPLGTGHVCIILTGQTGEPPAA
ncbi:class I SAM-dependent methyltransferase [Streptomyces sp. NPDC005132]|uniref:class I SAM-dependent methyltransferase n=1 Tax=Streptomyces sp. NPDC005132 TaxID=3154294 RepID=UPI0033ADBEB8